MLGFRFKCIRLALLDLAVFLTVPYDRNRHSLTTPPGRRCFRGPTILDSRRPVLENACMIDVLGDPRLPRLLSQAVHEFRTPLSVILGYLRMVLKDPSSSLDSRYRKMLEEAEKSVIRVRDVVAEMSELSLLEKGEITLRHEPLSLPTLLNDAVAALPEAPDGRPITITIETGGQQTMIRGDATWLTRAFTSILFALRREVVDTDQLVIREQTLTLKEKPVVWI